MATENIPEFLHLSLEIRDQKAYLQIKRPETFNSLNRKLLEEIGQAARFLQTIAHTTRVVLLTGAGQKAFVAGADIKEMHEMSPNDAHSFATLGATSFRAIAELPQIVLCGVHGYALGGGLELALCADILIASSKAIFGCPEVSLGIIPGFGGTQRLPRKIGYTRAMEWICTGQKYSADIALNAGLISRVVPPEDLMQTLETIAEQILQNGPRAVRAAKAVIRQGVELPTNDAINLESACFGLRFDEETKEGMGAFLCKRKPNYQ